MSLGEGYKFRVCERILRDNGWERVKYSRSSHVKFRKDGNTIVLSSGSQGVNRMIWKRLCKENNIKEET